MLDVKSLFESLQKEIANSDLQAYRTISWGKVNLC